MWLKVDGVYMGYRYDEDLQDTPLIRRTQRKVRLDELSWNIIFARLVFIALIITCIIYGIKLFVDMQNKNMAPINNPMIEQQRRDIKIVPEITEEENEELLLWKIIRQRQLDPYYPLTSDNKEMIKRNWKKISDGMTYREVARFLELLEMEYDDHGGIKETPRYSKIYMQDELFDEEEYKVAQQELQKKRRREEILRNEMILKNEQHNKGDGSENVQPQPENVQETMPDAEIRKTNTVETDDFRKSVMDAIRENIYSVSEPSEESVQNVPAPENSRKEKPEKGTQSKRNPE